MNFKKLGLFAAGTLFGTAGIKVLTSKDARKVYTEVTAAALRANPSTVQTWLMRARGKLKLILQEAES